MSIINDLSALFGKITKLQKEVKEISTSSGAVGPKGDPGKPGKDGSKVSEYIGVEMMSIEELKLMFPNSSVIVAPNIPEPRIYFLTSKGYLSIKA